MSTADSEHIEGQGCLDESSQAAPDSTLEEVIERIEGRDLGHLTSEDAVAALEAERARRMVPAESPGSKRSTAPS